MNANTPHTHGPTAAGHTPAQPRIAVIGGSLTGPVTALLLHAAGFDHVTLYETTPAGTSLAGGLIGLEHPALDDPRPARHRPVRDRGLPVGAHHADRGQGPCPVRSVTRHLPRPEHHLDPAAPTR